MPQPLAVTAAPSQVRRAEVLADALARAGVRREGSTPTAEELLLMALDRGLEELEALLRAREPRGQPA